MDIAFDQLVPRAAQPGPKGTRAAGRLMSAIENAPTQLPRLLQAMARQAGASDPADIPQPRLLLGITGAPGSGKSTLTDALVSAYRRKFPDRRVGVIAVDPSSPFSGGAVLGDRVRMMRHTQDPNVYVRSLASRGHLGGLSLGVKGVMRVMGLIGCDAVFIETVGVGQSEVEIAQVADMVMVVLAPGQGDSIQLLKAGLMEIGDVFVVNKADREGASQLYAALVSALNAHLLTHADALEHCGPGHMPTVHGGAARHESAGGAQVDNTDVSTGTAEALTDLSLDADDDAEVHLVASTTGQGIDELIDALERRIETSGAQWRRQRRDAIQYEIKQSVLEVTRQRIEHALAGNGTLPDHVREVLAGDATVEALADRLLRRVVDEGEQSASAQTHAEPHAEKGST